MTDIKSGDTVILDGGQHAEFVAKVFDGYIVRPLYQRGDDEPHLGNPMLVRTVLTEDPVPMFSEKVRALQTDVETLQRQVADLEHQRRAALDDLADTMKRIKAHPDLTRLDDFIAGKITHFVLESYGRPIIKTFQEAMLITDNVERGKLRLLVLYGDGSGKVKYGINRCSDGSGETELAYPCASLEEARAKAAALLEASWENYRANPLSGRILHYIKAATDIGLPIPDDIAAAFREIKLGVIKERIGKNRADGAQLLADLNELGGTLEDES